MPKVPQTDGAFLTLHAIYHERDFRVRVNDPTINFVRRTLAECVEGIPKPSPNPASWSCPACEAGFDPFVAQPNAEDRK